MSDANPVHDLAFRIHHTMLPVADLDRSIDPDGHAIELMESRAV